MNKRESKDTYFLKMATHVASQATCPRRAVGCVVINEYGHIKATGYNGVPRGFDHCSTDKPCGGECAASGTSLDSCHAVHAEQNALLQCENVMAIKTIYCTVSPCPTCAKLMANTGCKRVVYAEEYSDKSGIKFLVLAGIKVEHVRI